VKDYCSITFREKHQRFAVKNQEPKALVSTLSFFLLTSSTKEIKHALAAKPFSGIVLQPFCFFYPHVSSNED
jgi:hypothetical protein